MNITEFKELSEAISAFLTSLAIIVGGYWSYRLFVQRRQKYPRASISHYISHTYIGGEKLLLRVHMQIANKGDVLLEIVEGDLRVHQMLPVPGYIQEIIDEGKDPVPYKEWEIPWPLVGRRTCSWQRGKFEIEPNESDELHFDFVVDAEIRSVIVYSHFLNSRKQIRLLWNWKLGRNVGWGLTTTYDISPSQEESVSENKDKKPQIPSDHRQQEPKPVPPKPVPASPTSQPQDKPRRPANAQQEPKRLNEQQEAKRLSPAQQQQAAPRPAKKQNGSKDKEG